MEYAVPPTVWRAMEFLAIALLLSFHRKSSSSPYYWSEGCPHGGHAYAALVPIVSFTVTSDN